MGVDFNSPVLNNTIIDEFITVDDSSAFKRLNIIAREQGLLIGPSSGAVAEACYRYLDKLTENDVAVIIFGDSGRAYLSKNYFKIDDTDLNLATIYKEKQLQ